jgi:hypothetical protein
MRRDAWWSREGGMRALLRDADFVRQEKTRKKTPPGGGVK